ncbi:sugar phosphate nucleotidyltransferase [Cuniculiplasma sp. SKW3]|uniref:sugar phosphate nucleotidyltransferase n=2 Tax=unclassified Cuniculiplasma TaxID=2619706 RepID=UPI003FD02D2B
MALKGVLMAGGKGTRLRPITYAIPKPLVPIAGLPCIEYSLRAFHEASIDDVIVTTGYKFESLISGLIKQERKDGQKVLFSVEREPAGTAGSVKIIENFLDDTFVVGSGDVLADFNITEALENHKKSGNVVTILLTEVEDPTQFGIVETQDGKVKKFLEKPTREEVFSNKVNSGIYILEPEVLKHIPEGMQYDFGKDLFPKLLKEGITINTYEAKGTWLDTGRPRELILANHLIVSKYGKEVNKELINGKIIMKEEPIGSKYRIEGNCYLGENVKIGENSKIRNSTIYENVTISDNVTIEDSIIFDGCSIGSESEISKSVIMKNTNIGKKCILSNSALSSNLNLQNGSRIYDVNLSSESMNNLD